jgi:methionyl-tRNA synthetase
MEKRRVLVCSAWPYASGLPHLGNLASSLLSGDVFARYYRLRGKDVLYVSGTDAHGTRIEFAARQEGIEPAELAERNHRKILEILRGFSIAFDNYTTTESPVHKTFVREIYLQMEENGFIFTQTEQRAFCERCGRFLADRLITGTCPHCGSPGAMGNQCDACGTILEPEELVDPKCCFCGSGEIEFRETRHWYLDLPRLAEPLHSYVASRDFQGNVALFTQRMIADGLRARAMTRDIEWGIPAPFDGAEGKVIYVWGEAALGYVSAVVEHFGAEERWKDFWFGDDVHQIYTMAKDNIPFHTLIFPGQLISSGRGYHLPDQIAATEYLNWIGGESFSKSRGIGLYCDDALRLLDGEMWRFYLLYNRPEGRDVSFSWEELEKAINGVLISNIANLFNRVLSFIQTEYDGRVPEPALDGEVTERLAAGIKKYEASLSDGVLGQALRAVCDLAAFGNEYFQRKKPWASCDRAAVASAAHLVKGMAILLTPFVPTFSSAVLAVMGIENPTWAQLEETLGGHQLGEERVLLERIEIDQIREVMEAGGGEPGSPSHVVSFSEFERLDLRIGVICSVEEIPGADRLYRVTVDLGGDVRTCVAGIREAYSHSELIGRSVAVVANLEPVEIRGVRSECMLLAASGERLSLIGPDRLVEPGTPVV